MSDFVKACLWVFMLSSYCFIMHEMMDLNIFVEMLIVIPTGALFVLFCNWLLDFDMGAYIRGDRK